MGSRIVHCVSRVAWRRFLQVWSLPHERSECGYHKSKNRRHAALDTHNIFRTNTLKTRLVVFPTAAAGDKILFALSSVAWNRPFCAGYTCTTRRIFNVFGRKSILTVWQIVLFERYRKVERSLDSYRDKRRVHWEIKPIFAKKMNLCSLLNFLR